MILGQRVRLRPVEKDDLPRFVKWFSDPDVRTNLALYLPMSLGQEEKWYERNLQASDTQAWAIDAQPADMAVGPWVHIGSCGFHHIEWRNRLAELGISIGARDYWNRGYGTDAVATLVSFGFNTLNLNRVWLRVFADNPRAIRCYEKVGFKLEGRLRQDNFNAGAYRDTLLMGLLRSDLSELPAETA
jgi:diamine N-acetyltransferase